MGRKRKGEALQYKIDGYLKEYDLDDINSANDMAALVQMCQLEINMEQIQNALATIKDPVEDSKRMRDLQGALKDVTSSWVALQKELGISRISRKDDSEDSPVKYIDHLKVLSKKFIEKRLKPINCPKCGQLLGKFMIYVQEKGEKGAIAYEGKQIDEYRKTIEVECWKCGHYFLNDAHKGSS